jgi:D-alanyl-D-alanine dipeptidase
LSVCPPGFVDVAVALPAIKRVMPYGSANNFTGAPLPGYVNQEAWLHESCIETLSEIVDVFTAKGYILRLYDAYRPVRAVLAMVDWAVRVGRQDLMDIGYIVPKSRHCKGCAVDVSLERISTGEILDMGTPWDHFSDESHALNASGQVLENRMLLRKPFVERGWRAARTEWWHFDRERDGMVDVDVPYPA